MKRISILGMSVFILSGLMGCSEDPVTCYPPLAIKSYCGPQQSLDSCDCLSGPVDVVAYVDLVNLPSTILVSAIGKYGHYDDMIHLACIEGGAEVPECGYDPEWPNVLYGFPIKAVVEDAFIRKVMQPGNGSQIPTWHLEIQSAEQVNYYHVVNDSTDVLIVAENEEGEVLE